MTGLFDVGYATHLPVLAAAVARTGTGPVLELGAGTGSTPLLHMLCEHRELWTLESDEKWLAMFEPHFSTFWHKLLYIDDWNRLYSDPQYDRQFAVIFVDHAPGERRAVDIERLADKCTYMVVHDTEEGGYGYEDLFRTFKYRYDWKFGRPWTTILSNVEAWRT